MKLSDNTISIWSEVNMHSEKYLNPYFDRLKRKDPILKIPITNYFELKIWKELYFKYTEWTCYITQSRYKTPE